MTPRFAAVPFLDTKPGELLFVPLSLGGEVRNRLGIRAFLPTPPDVPPRPAVIVFNPTPDGHPVAFGLDGERSCVRGDEPWEFYVDPASEPLHGNRANEHRFGSLVLIGQHWLVAVEPSMRVISSDAFLDLQDFQVTWHTPDGPRFAFMDWGIRLKGSGAILYDANALREAGEAAVRV